MLCSGSVSEDVHGRVSVCVCWIIHVSDTALEKQMEHALLVGTLQPYLMEEKKKYSQFILAHAGYQLYAEAQALFFLL